MTGENPLPENGGQKTPPFARITGWCLIAITLVAGYDYLAEPLGYGIFPVSTALIYFGSAALLIVNLAIHVARGEPWDLRLFGQITRQRQPLLYWAITASAALLAVLVNVIGVFVISSTR
jgi:hypothetical protein